ncbi:hypothetical protein OIU76_014243 [Salix suchowensis]|nr:hypothetical protein OIU76_014243 [Salix suchowensis]
MMCSPLALSVLNSIRCLVRRRVLQKLGGEEQKGTGASSSARGNLVALKRFQKLKQLSEAICKFQELETPRNREPTQLSLIQRPHDRFPSVMLEHIFLVYRVFDVQIIICTVKYISNPPYHILNSSFCKTSCWFVPQKKKTRNRY